MGHYPTSNGQFRCWIMRCALSAIEDADRYTGARTGPEMVSAAEASEAEAYTRFVRLVTGDWWRLRGKLQPLKLQDFDIEAAWDAACNLYAKAAPPRRQALLKDGAD